MTVAYLPVRVSGYGRPVGDRHTVPLWGLLVQLYACDWVKNYVLLGEHGRAQRP
jgi:hypothetical protein